MARFINGLSLNFFSIVAADYSKRRTFRYWALVSIFRDRCLHRRNRGVYQHPNGKTAKTVNRKARLCRAFHSKCGRFENVSSL
jgi:hypothetical protein